jgi:hypothetical protein
LTDDGGAHAAQVAIGALIGRFGSFDNGLARGPRPPFGAAFELERRRDGLAVAVVAPA